MFEKSDILQLLLTSEIGCPLPPCKKTISQSVGIHFLNSTGWKVKKEANIRNRYN